MNPQNQQILDQISKLILVGFDQESMLKSIADQILPAMGDYCRICIVDGKKQVNNVIINHIEKEKIELVRELYQKYQYKYKRNEDHYGVKHILQTGRPELISQVEEEARKRVQGNKPLIDIVDKLEIRSYMGAPLIVHQKIIGTIIVTSTRPERRYSIEDLSLLEEIARRISLKIENITLYTQAQQEILKRKRAERTIKRIAYHDPLTQLPNRLLFYKHTEKAMAKGEKFAILFLDLNQFKDINDIFGHDVGDKILVQLSKKFRQLVKDKGIVSRFGGDEFTFLLTGIEGKHDVKRLINKILDSLKAPIILNENAFYVSTSIGVSIYPEDGKELQTLLKRSDISMYYAKKSARINYSFYTNKIISKNAIQIEFENYLRNAIVHNEFEIYYQPIINTYTKEITSAEALIRWNHPQQGMLSPSQFLQHADEIGLSFIIDLWVLKTVYNQKKNGRCSLMHHFPDFPLIFQAECLNRKVF